MRNLLIIQIIFTAVVSGVGLQLLGGPGAKSALYGGGIALVNSLLLGWRVRRAGAAAGKSVTQGAFTLYWGAIERFVFTMVAFIVGMGLLRLRPEPLLAAFAVAQLAYWIAAQGTLRRQQ